MSIFLNENSKVIVQGMTGSEGRKHTQRMLASGTAIVGGVNPSKAGQNVDFDGASVPVFGSVAEGRRILDEANHPLVTQVDTMDNAADKAAELAAAGAAGSGGVAGA